MPAAEHAAFLHAFANALHSVFFWGIVIAAVPLLLSWMLKETPLRTTLAVRSADHGVVEQDEASNGHDEQIPTQADALSSRGG